MYLIFKTQNLAKITSCIYCISSMQSLMYHHSSSRSLLQTTKPSAPIGQPPPINTHRYHLSKDHVNGTLTTSNSSSYTWRPRHPYHLSHPHLSHPHLHPSPPAYRPFHHFPSHSSDDRGRHYTTSHSSHLQYSGSWNNGMFAPMKSATFQYRSFHSDHRSFDPPSADNEVQYRYHSDHRSSDPPSADNEVQYRYNSDHRSSDPPSADNEVQYRYNSDHRSSDPPSADNEVQYRYNSDHRSSDPPSADNEVQYRYNSDHRSSDPPSADNEVQYRYNSDHRSSDPPSADNEVQYRYNSDHRSSDPPSADNEVQYRYHSDHRSSDPPLASNDIQYRYHSDYRTSNRYHTSYGHGNVRMLYPPLRPKVHINRLKRSSGTNRHYPKISVMTYNILSQDLIDDNDYLYNKAEHLEWDYRKSRLLNELVTSGADIICLQEMHVDHYKDWYQPNLEKRNYRGLYVKRTGDHSDGCAVFYNTTYVKLIEHEAVHYQQQKGTLNRDNVGLIGRFQLVNGSPLPADQRDFIVANTHILFNPRAGEVKLAQICFLLAKMNKMATNGDQTLPCILCGDFNCLPSSPFMRFLLNGHLNYSELSATAVAGYRSRRAAKHRQIPIPLLPQDMGISLDCKYQTADVDELITDESSDPLLVKDKSTKDSSLIGEDFSLSDDTSLANDDQHDDSPDSKRIKLSSEPPPAAIANESQDAVLSHSFNFISCYPLPRHGTSLVTTYHNSAAEMVDYILCTVASGDTGPTGFHPIGRRVLPSFHTLMKLGPQPNQVLSSDHLYLLVELQLVNK